jgi:hypothetical protein
VLRGKRGPVMRARWQLLVLIAALLACVSLAQTQQGHAVLGSVGLYETPASYTELAFSDPGHLPGALATPNASIKVSFTIHNVSGNSRSYQWSIILANSGKDQVATNGTALSPAQGQTEVTRSVKTYCVNSRLQVTVRLASPAESISFWMTCPLGTGKQAKK